MAQGDADTNGEEDAEIVLVSNNPLEEIPILEAATLIAAQLTQ